MDTKKIAYIVVTAVFCIGILPGAVLDIAQPDFVAETMAGIQLPLYVLTLIGIWKLLGIVALAAPQFRRVNEWAYAGFFFDLTGAMWVHLAGGDPLSSAVPAGVLMVPLFASYWLRDARQMPATSTLGRAATA